MTNLRQNFNDMGASTDDNEQLFVMDPNVF